MIDPRLNAQKLLGPIDWQSEVSGYCRCPGHTFHTSPTKKKDCRVNIDGAPTIYCFHSSCEPAVVEANRRLRRDLNASPWELLLPGGRKLRSGDILQPSGAILPRETLAARPRDPAARLLIASVHAAAQRFAPEMFDTFHWPMAQIEADSPLPMAHRDPESHFRTWLAIWPRHSVIWIGDIFSSGRPEHAHFFRPVSDWYDIGPAFGNFTSGAAFKPGTYARSNQAIAARRFLVVESDTLARDQVGAIFAYLNRRLRFNLRAIIDTAGKSLHAWFSPPRSPALEAHLKATLSAFGCDPKLFTYSQPVRVPGAWRAGKLQRLVWLRQ